eukprot:scaffold4562_cov255-Pinguiococcus_pyrenoidosus.AAC.21
MVGHVDGPLTDTSAGKGAHSCGSTVVLPAREVGIIDDPIGRPSAKHSGDIPLGSCSQQDSIASAFAAALSADSLRQRLQSGS